MGRIAGKFVELKSRDEIAELKYAGKAVHLLALQTMWLVCNFIPSNWPKQVFPECRTTFFALNRFAVRSRHCNDWPPSFGP